MNKARFAAITAFVIWGANIVVTKHVLMTMPFYIMGLLRYAIATPTFGIKTLQSLLYIKGKVAKLLFVKTILNVLQMATLFLALVLVDASFVSMFGLLLPLIVYNLAVRILHEKNDGHLLIGSLIAIIGSLVATFAVTSITGNLNIIGLVLITINMLADAVTTIFTKQLRTYLSGDQLNSMFFATSVVFYFVFTLVMWGQFNFADIAQSAWLGSVWLAVLNSVIAMRLYMYAIKKINATEFSIYVYISPIVGMVASIVFLGESHNTLFWIGVGVVLMGVMYAERWMKFRIPSVLMHRPHHRS